MQWLCNESYSIIVRLKVISFVLLFGLSLWGLYFILDCCWKVYCPPPFTHCIWGFDQHISDTAETLQAQQKYDKLYCTGL